MSHIHLAGLFLTALTGMLGLWLVDLAHSSADGKLCNGWWCLSAIKGFHLGLYLAGGALVAVTLLATLGTKKAR